MSSYTHRIVRASLLDTNIYEEVEADTHSMSQAMATVVLSSIAGGLAVYSTAGVTGIVAGTVGSLIGWYVWAFLTYLIGTRLLPAPTTHSDVGELLRTLGFASAPGLIRVLGVISPLSQVVALVASLWMLAAMVVAVRQALDYTSTMRALGVCFIGWLVQAAVLLLMVFLVVGLGGGGQGPQF